MREVEEQLLLIEILLAEAACLFNEGNCIHMKAL